MIPALMALAMLGSAAAGRPASGAPSSVEGVWHNPKNSVAVKTGSCGNTLCGWVVRASDEAQADARYGGTSRLIGTALLREYRQSGHKRWAGQIFVPDMGRTFGSTITLVDTNTIDVKGCLIGGFLCKTQTWRRD